MSKVFTSGFTGQSAEFHSVEPYVQILNQHIMIGVMLNGVQAVNDIAILMTCGLEQDAGVIAGMNLALNAVMWVGMIVEKMEYRKMLVGQRYDPVVDSTSQMNITGN